MCYKEPLPNNHTKKKKNSLTNNQRHANPKQDKNFTYQIGKKHKVFIKLFFTNVGEHETSILTYPWLV